MIGVPNVSKPTYRAPQNRAPHPTPPCLTTPRGQKHHIPQHLTTRIATSTVPYQQHPGTTNTWHNTTTLLHPTTWRTITTNYQHAQGFTHQAPATACSLQHYAGRYLATHLTFWANTSLILDPDHHHWHAHINHHGATTTTANPHLPITQRGDTTDATHAAITHLTPIIQATRTNNNITEHLAWGCIAASFANIFTTIHHSATPNHHTSIRHAAHTAHNILTTITGKPLIHWKPHPHTNPLHHHRTTCCLMRLSTTKTPCTTCPDTPNPPPPTPPTRHWPITWSTT